MEAVDAAVRAVPGEGPDQVLAAVQSAEGEQQGLIAVRERLRWTLREIVARLSKDSTLVPACWPSSETPFGRMRWNSYGTTGAQLVVKRSARQSGKDGLNSEKPLPAVATIRLTRSMVNRAFATDCHR
jgi:hypothetical protein